MNPTFLARPFFVAGTIFRGRRVARRLGRTRRRLVCFESLEPKLALTAESWAAGIGVGSSSQLLADVNGDGRDDCVVVYTSGSLAGDWYAALSDGTAFTGFRRWIAGHGAGASWVGAADVTGDGRDDAVIAFTSGGLAGNWYVAASTGSGFAAPTLWTTGHGVGSTAVGLGDVDGDGKADAVATYLSGGLAGNWYVARSSGSGFQSYSLWASGLGIGADIARLGDVTGDGRADAVAVYRAGTLAGNWYVSASTGTRFSNYTRWYEGHGAGAERVLLADVNGDGRKDAVAYFASGEYAGRWYVATSISSTFVAASQFRSELPGTALAGDITGDGTDDPVTFSPGDGRWWSKRSDWQYATTVVSTGGTRDLSFLYPATTLVIPVNIDAVSTGAITAPAGSSLVVTGGGQLQQAGAINPFALAISPGITNSSNSGLNLSGPGLSPTALLLTGSAVLTAPGGVTVSSVLGLSAGTSVSETTSVTVTAGGVIQGAGTFGGPLSIDAGGVLAPAFDAGKTAPTGQLRIGRLTLAAGSELSIDTVGSPTKVDHDQLTVTGPVVLTGSRLRLTNTGFWPQGSRVTLIDNQTSSFVEGGFVDAQGTALPEGALLPAATTGAGLDLWLTYRGGDGNDVALVSNAAPTAVLLSDASVAENLPAGTIVGTLTTTDPDSGNTFTYSLVSGTDSADNSSFAIVGNQLQAAASFNFETKSAYSIRVRSTDQGGLSTEQMFTITVTDVNEAPTNIILSAITVDENHASGEAVGTLSTIDPDAGSTFTYALVSGAGSTGNAFFAIDGATLRTVTPFNYEAKSSYSIRLRSTQSGGLWTEKVFVIRVGDVIETLATDHIDGPADRSYKAGDWLRFTAVLTRPTTVVGKPTIELAVGSSKQEVVYESGSGTSQIVFAYRVKAGDNAPAGVVLGRTIRLPTGARVHMDGTNLPLALPAIATPGVVVDTTAPRVTTVAGPAASRYKAGAVLRFSAATSENVVVTGRPLIPVTVGSVVRQAIFVPDQSGPKSLVFEYVVQPGDNGGHGITVGGSIVIPKDAAIVDVAGNAIVPIFARPKTSKVLVDTLAPTASAAAAPAAKTYIAGEAIDFKVSFPEAVQVTGVPAIPVVIGSASRDATFAGFVAGSGGRSLLFRARATAGDVDNDGITVGGSVLLGNGTITDLAGNTASTTLPAVLTSKIKVEAVLPRILSVTLPVLSADGAALTVRVTFSEAVVVTGKPTIPFTLGGAARTFKYASGSKAATLVFAYVVNKAADDMKLPVLLGSTLGVSGATIRDLVGNALASTTLPSAG